MTIEPKPDNQPGFANRSDAVDKDGEVADPATAQRKLEEQEEEAAKLGDFA